MRPQQPPTLIYLGIERTVTPQLIALLVRDGMTPADYEGLDLIRHYYGFPTIGHLITDALDRSGEETHVNPPRTNRKGGRQ